MNALDNKAKRLSLGMHLWIAIPCSLLVTIIAIGIAGWVDGYRFYAVAQHEKELRIQAETYKEEVRMTLVRHIEITSEFILDKQYNDAFIYLTAMIESRPESDSIDALTVRREAVIAFLHELWGEEVDFAQINEHLAEIDAIK